MSALNLSFDRNISINPQSFNNAVTEALNRCDELETQLQGLESWVDLPIVNTSDHGANFEDASEDAQRLVGMLQQVQSAMLSAVSEKALKEALPERLKAVAAAKTESHEQQQRTAVMAKQQFYQQQHQQQMSEYPAAVSGFMQEEVQRPHQDTLYTQQQSRIYGDVSSPYNHPNQPFLGERTGPDNNMMGP